MSIRVKFFLVNLLIIFIFIGNFSYLLFETQNTRLKVEEMEEKDMKIAIQAEQLRFATVQVQQWLTDISATRAEEGYDDGFIEAENYANSFRETIEELKVIDSENSVFLEDSLSSFEDFYVMGKKMANAYINEGHLSGNLIMLDFDAFSQDIHERMEQYRIASEQLIDEKVQDLQASSERATKIAIFSGIISVLFIFIFTHLTVNPIVKKLKDMSEKSEEYSKGDLRRETSLVESNDEVGKLAKDIVTMRRSFKEIIENALETTFKVTKNSDKLKSSTNQVKGRTKQITEIVQEIATGVETQATSSNNLSEIMSDFSSEISEANKRGESVVKETEKVLEMTNEGNKGMVASVEKMKTINNIVEESVKRVKNLDEHTKEISKLVSVIEDIAEQTNLLSLNASIEAARAGEQGKGFAVVAEEIRKLSDDVKVSVSDITNIVNNILEESEKTFTSLDVGYKEVEEGTEQINATSNKILEMKDFLEKATQEVRSIGNNLNVLTNKSVGMNNDIETIAAISEEMASGLKEVTSSVQKNNVSIEEVDENTEQLYLLVNELKEKLEIFKTK